MWHRLVETMCHPYPYLARHKKTGLSCRDSEYLLLPGTFSKENGSMMPPVQNPHQIVTRFGCICFLTRGFFEYLKCDNSVIIDQR